MKTRNAKVKIKGTIGHISWGNGEFKNNIPELEGDILGFSGDHIQFLRNGDTQMLTIDTRIPWVEVHVYPEPPIY